MRTLLLSAALAPALLIATAAWAQSGLATGAYACWYFTGPQSGLNFTLLADGKYEDDKGKSGTVKFHAASRRLSFKGGALDRETAVYEVRKGTPTVTFPRRRAQVSSCELTKP